MILLVTPSERASECAKALHEATGEGVAVAESLSRAAALLRAECYRAVVLDQYLLETEPHETEITLEHLGTAILVQVNLAITGMDRLLREVRAAMQRRQRDEVRARQAALAELHSELNGTITALLLSSELALGTPDLRPAAAEKLQSIHELVKKLRKQLETTGITGAPERAEHV
ncbi:MAG: hypothetical protein ABSF66_07720 [Terriglobales bacterium]|jgi:hypothetical protein